MSQHTITVKDGSVIGTTSWSTGFTSLNHHRITRLDLEADINRCLRQAELFEADGNAEAVSYWLSKAIKADEALREFKSAKPAVHHPVDEPLPVAA